MAWTGQQVMPNTEQQTAATSSVDRTFHASTGDQRIAGDRDHAGWCGTFSVQARLDDGSDH